MGSVRQSRTDVEVELKSVGTRAREDARRILLEARQEVERAIREVREAATGR